MNKDRISLSDQVVWGEGEPVFWFDLYQKLDELGYELRLYSEVPKKAVMVEGRADFLFASRKQSRYGYFATYQNAVGAMSNALKQAYADLYARHLETLQAIQAEKEKRQVCFSFRGETRIFNRDEIDGV